MTEYICATFAQMPPAKLKASVLPRPRVEECLDALRSLACHDRSVLDLDQDADICAGSQHCEGADCRWLWNHDPITDVCAVVVYRSAP